MNKARMWTLTSCIQHCTGGPSQFYVAKGEIKSSRLKRKKYNCYFSTDSMIIYITNPIESTKKLLEQISESNKVVGYKDTIQIYVYTLAPINKI